jgi:hypothetical protein
MARTPDHDPDAGMRAVARVRGVREQDSRLGLTRAAADQREAARRLDAVAARLAGATDPEAIDPSGFATARLAAAGVAAELIASQVALGSATTVATAARAHWQHDHTRLAAVELLLERRADERRAERLRRERVEVDDLVAARWLRAHRPPNPAGTPR